MKPPKKPTPHVMRRLSHRLSTAYEWEKELVTPADLQRAWVSIQERIQGSEELTLHVPEGTGPSDLSLELEAPGEDRVARLNAYLEVQVPNPYYATAQESYRKQLTKYNTWLEDQDKITRDLRRAEYEALKAEFEGE